MKEMIEKLQELVEVGKVDANAPFPPQLKGQPGVDEVTKECLEAGISPREILDEALMPAMDNVGAKFAANQIFVPQMLLAAKAMAAALFHLKPFFKSGEIQSKGTFIMGTVKGDLHDIGKNLVIMMIEGSGWDVIDLGVDVPSSKFVEVIKENPSAVVGMSALLTTTMTSMEEVVGEIRKECGDISILIGGAPITTEFCQQIGADHYSQTPQDAVEYLKQFAA